MRRFFSSMNQKYEAPESGKPVQGESPSLDEANQHLNDICNRFILGTGWVVGDLSDLPIADLCILITNTNWALEKNMFIGADERMQANIALFQDVLVEKMKSADILYVVMDEVTGYPFIDGSDRDSIWMFSRQEYAANAAQHFAQQHRRFRVDEVKKGELAAFLAEAFSMLGAQGVLMNNGVYGCIIQKDALEQSPGWKDVPPISIPVMNPGLMRAHLKLIQEAQWPVNYEAREQALNLLERDLSKQLIKAQFLIPAKGLPALKDGTYSTTLEKDTTISFPGLNGKDGSKGIPAFTDWKQFRLCYDGKEFSGLIMTFAELMDFVLKHEWYGAAVINAGKCPLELDAKSMQRLCDMAAQAD